MTSSDKIKNTQVHSFFIISNALVDDGHIARMGAAAYAVYSCLCRHANTKHKCFPSYTKLQEETGLSRATVAKTLATLLELRYIQKTPAKKGRSNIYEILDLPTHSNDAASSKTKLVQNLNQFKNQTSGSSKIKPMVVQNLNSKNTNGRKLNEENTLLSEQKKSDTSKGYSDGSADARKIQTLPHGVPSPSPESETNGKDSNADQKDICSAKSVKKPKRSRSLDGLRGNSSRQYQQAMAEKAALTLFNSDQEEQSFYQWAKQNLGKEGERQADISISRLRNKVKATPRDKELLETFRKTTRGPQKAPQQTREARMASVAEKYKTDPSILKKDATTFHREYGVSIHNFKGYLFEVGVL